MSEHELPPFDETQWVGLDDYDNILLPPITSNGTYPTDPLEPDSWTPQNLADLPDTPPVQPTLGGLGIVYPGKRHVFSGPQESAKTLAAYAIGLQVVRTGATLVIIDFEMGRYDARNRLRELGATHDDFARIRYLEPHEPATTTTMTTLVTLEPALVIIDAAAGAYDLQGLDDNKRQDVERFTSLYVREFWRHDIATIVLDHVVKNTENRGNYAIGSERKTGGADVHIGFETITPLARGSHGLYKIHTRKDRGGYLKRGHFANLTLKSDPETHHLTWEITSAETAPEGETWMPTIYMERVSRYLEQQDPEPCSRTHLEENVEGGTDYIRSAIDALKRHRYINETRGPRSSRLYTNTRPFTVSEWEKHLHPATPPDPASTPPQAGSRTTPPPRLSLSGEAGRGRASDSPQKPTTPPAEEMTIDDLPY